MAYDVFSIYIEYIEIGDSTTERRPAEFGKQNGPSGRLRVPDDNTAIFAAFYRVRPRGEPASANHGTSRPASTAAACRSDRGHHVRRRTTHPTD